MFILTLLVAGAGVTGIARECVNAPIFRDLMSPLLEASETLSSGSITTLSSDSLFKNSLRALVCVGLGSRPIDDRVRDSIRECSLTVDPFTISSGASDYNLTVHEVMGSKANSNVLLVHGLWNNDRSMKSLATAAAMADRRAFLFSFSGFSQNPGFPSAEVCSKNIESVLQHISSSHSEPIDIVTHSNGAAPVVDGLLALKKRGVDIPIRKLIFISAYNNFADVHRSNAEFIVPIANSVIDSYGGTEVVDNEKLRAVLKALSTEEGVQFIGEIFENEWQTGKVLNELLDMGQSVEQVILIHGKNDKVVPPATLKGRVQPPLINSLSDRSNVQAIVLPERGHFTLVENDGFPEKEVLSVLSS